MSDGKREIFGYIHLAAPAAVRVVLGKTVREPQSTTDWLREGTGWEVKVYPNIELRNPEELIPLSRHEFAFQRVQNAPAWPVGPLDKSTIWRHEPGGSGWRIMSTSLQRFRCPEDFVLQSGDVIVLDEIPGAAVSSGLGASGYVHPGSVPINVRVLLGSFSPAEIEEIDRSRNDLGWSVQIHPGIPIRPWMGLLPLSAHEYAYRRSSDSPTWPNSFYLLGTTQIWRKVPGKGWTMVAYGWRGLPTGFVLEENDVVAISEASD